ncbi:hypothetical protein CC77DRAFT_23943 [Alternaria alternata]|uniref:Uncharacterized protein n=1 Tax=Alternaria alternata TaxID=5599 RepID=A0A177E3U3_ALTAL|nr:hypothetical protein CC77DRAFT_23943 [Alternaria alternata]OAG26090.1 hypothetical protein CC77DRAFT_23943 [Alternaria alternata]
MFPQFSVCFIHLSLSMSVYLDLCLSLHSRLACYPSFMTNLHLLPSQYISTCYNRSYGGENHCYHP